VESQFQFAPGIFRFQGRGSILSPPREHFRVVNICLRWLITFARIATWRFVDTIPNRLRTGVRLFRSTMHKWDLVPSADCRCGEEEQTADHILASCPLYHPPNGTLGLAALDDNTVDWLQTTELCI